MKKVIAVLAAIGGMAFGDTVFTSGANGFVNIPAGFVANTSIGNTPYWNNLSVDGANLNIGDFVTNQNVAGFGGVSASPLGSQYFASVANNNNAPLSFSMIRSLASINVTILYQNAPLSNTGANGTSFGIYDVANPTNKIQIFGPGTIPGSVGGAGTNVSTAGISGIGNYGFYATVCQPGFGSGNCYTFFSDTSLDSSVTNSGSGFVVENGTTNPHQHFALFALSGNATTFYLGFENSVTSSAFDGVSGPEKYGDFNDIIFQITTNGGVGGVPEPATLSMMGLGLLGLGLMGRRRLRK